MLIYCCVCVDSREELLHILILILLHLLVLAVNGMAAALLKEVEGEKKIYVSGQGNRTKLTQRARWCPSARAQHDNSREISKKKKVSSFCPHEFFDQDKDFSFCLPLPTHAF